MSSRVSRTLGSYTYSAKGEASPSPQPKASAAALATIRRRLRELIEAEEFEPGRSSYRVTYRLASQRVRSCGDFEWGQPQADDGPFN